MEFEIGKDYKTRGGWRARCIWTASAFDSLAPVSQQDGFITTGSAYVVHKPRTREESVPILHMKNGEAIVVLGVHIPPAFGQHPADIVGEWNGE